MLDERAYLRDLRSGEPGAFEQLLDAYGARVLGLVRRYVNGEADAEDLAQEVFIAIHRSLPGFRGECALGTWVYRVTLNQCCKRLRRAEPHTVPLDVETEAGPAQDPVTAAIGSELRDDVSAALDALPDHHRDVVLLHELHGLTYLECAQALGVPVGTVKSRLSNAFRKLRVSLDAYSPPGVAEAPEGLRA